ncbi:unnamed protein product [Diamesa tonsa]
MECDKVINEVDKVITKFSAISEHASKMISDEIRFLGKLKEELSDSPADCHLTTSQVLLLKDAIQRSKLKLQQFCVEHRDLHGTVSKVGKSIDRNFCGDFTAVTRHDLFESERNIKLLNENIVQHFFRMGMDDIAETLIRESGLPKEDINEEPFAELHKIFEQIHSHNLQPAIEWATKFSEELEYKSSSLEFKLHRLAFIQILKGGPKAQSEAISYARANLSKFVVRFQKEFQILMGCLLFLKVGLENSPYSYLLRDDMWIECADVFIKDACMLSGINKDSPLAVIVNAGCVALPALLNLKQVMSRQVQGIWSGRDELPIEIEIENRYHSIFACPILRQQSSEENPPMRLKCGHVISRDALNKLSNNSISLKCPYCPQEQTINDAKLIYF